MRVGTAWSQQLGVNAMNAQQAKMSKTQMQLSTGNRILTPSDDTTGSVKALNLQEASDRTAQYQKNIDVVRSRLNVEESSLSTAENIIFRAKELTVQSLNSTLKTEDRLAIKSEIDQLLKQMVGVANTKNANGEYIFSGDLSNVKPVVFDSVQGRYIYQGGVNARTLDISSERQVGDNDLGSTTFVAINSVSQSAQSTINGQPQGMRSIFDTLQTLSSSLTSKYTLPNAVIQGDRFMRAGIDYSTTPTSFNLTNDTGSAVTVTLPTAPDTGIYTDISQVVSAINLQLTGSNMQARSHGNQLEFISTTQGKNSSITLTANAGTFLTDFGFTSGTTGKAVDLGATITGTKVSSVLNYATSPASFELNDEAGNSQVITLASNYTNQAALITDIQTQIAASTGATGIAGKIEVDATANPIQFRSVSSGSTASVQIKQVSGDFLKNTGFTSGDTARLFNQTANDALTDLNTTLDNFLKVRTTVGTRLNALDDQEQQNSKFMLDMKTTLSQVKDLDFAAAISRFTIEKTALQAAQQAYSKVQKLSLFNFL